MKHLFTPVVDAGLTAYIFSELWLRIQLSLPNYTLQYFLSLLFLLQPQSSAAKKNFFLPPIAVYAPHSGCDECEHKKFAPAHSSLRSSTITSVFCSKVHGGVHSYRSNKNSRGPSSYQVLWSGERLRKKKKFTQATQRGHDAVLESLLTREQAMKNQDQTNWLPKNLQGIT